MSSKEKVAARLSPEMPLKRKRGRKPLSPSPPLRNPGPLSFFKVLVGDFKDVLFIPPMAACTLDGLAKKYVFIEDINGNPWKVMMSMVDGSLAFENGWHYFVLDHSLTVGEFVLFTYNGGLLFTARIFGTSALERMDFQLKRRKGRYAKENNVRIPKTQKISQASDEKHDPSGTEVPRSSKRKKFSRKCDFPEIHAIESDSISDGISELSSPGEKPLYDSKSKESKIALHDSEQTWHGNSDATVGELNMISPTEHTNSDIENNEVVGSESIRNSLSTTENEAALLHRDETLLSKQTAKAMTKTGASAVKAHCDSKEASTEMSGSILQMNKDHGEMRNNGKTEQYHLHEREMFNSKPHDDKIASLSNLEHSECSPKMEFNLIKSERIADFFLSVDGICHTTLDDKLIEIATEASYNANGLEESLCQSDNAIFASEISVPCGTILALPTNPVSDRTEDKKETLMSISEEYGVPQTKGSSTLAESGLQSCNEVRECKHEIYPEIVEGNDWQSGISARGVFFDEDEKNVTPCSNRRCSSQFDRTDSVEIPSSSCVRFSVFLSGDVQSFLELRRTLVSQLGKARQGKKVFVLQDPSMRCWPVLYNRSTHFVGLIGGWIDFAKANNICKGDICDFELIDKMEHKFRVQITKAEGSIFDEKVA